MMSLMMTYPSETSNVISMEDYRYSNQLECLCVFYPCDYFDEGDIINVLVEITPFIQDIVNIRATKSFIEIITILPRKAADEFHDKAYSLEGEVWGISECDFGARPRVH